MQHPVSRTRGQAGLRTKCARRPSAQASLACASLSAPDLGFGVPRLAYWHRIGETLYKFILRQLCRSPGLWAEIRCQCLPYPPCSISSSHAASVRQRRTHRWVVSHLPGSCALRHYQLLFWPSRPLFEKSLGICDVCGKHKSLVSLHAWLSAHFALERLGLLSLIYREDQGMTFALS